MKCSPHPIVLLLAFIFSLFSCTTENNKAEKPNKEVLSVDSLSNGTGTLLSCFLQAKKLEDPSACVQKYREEIKLLQPEQADTVIYTLHQRLIEIAADHDVSGNYEMDVEAETKRVKDFGLTVDSEEGMPFYCINWHYLYHEFHAVVSKNLKAFLEYRSTFPEKITYDAGLSISYRELAERLVAAEKLLANGPFIMSAYMLEEISYESFWFMNGLDNSPAFDYETGIMPEENRDAIRFLIENGGTVIGELMKEYQTYLTENEWKRDESMNEKFSFQEVKKRMEKAYPLATK